MSEQHIITPQELAALEQAQGPEMQAAQFTVQALAPILVALGNQLAAVSHQLDLLIRLECGHLKRADLKREIEEMAERAQLEQAAADVSKNGHG